MDDWFYSQIRMKQSRSPILSLGWIIVSVGVLVCLLLGTPAYMYSGLNWSNNDEASDLGLTESELRSIRNLASWEIRKQNWRSRMEKLFVESVVKPQILGPNVGPMSVYAVDERGNTCLVTFDVETDSGNGRIPIDFAKVGGEWKEISRKEEAFSRYSRKGRGKRYENGTHEQMPEIED